MKMTDKKPAGRPKKLDSVGIAAVCELVAQSVTLRDIAKRYNVSLGLISEFLTAHNEQYARAREAEADRLAEEILFIADNSTGCEAVARLQIDARKWLASKKNPKKYGDRISQEISAELSVKNMTLEQVRAELAKLDE